MDRRARPALTCACFFVATYSLLPHKELRFVLPANPLFNACAAVAVDRCVYRAVGASAARRKKTDGDATSDATSATRRMKGAALAAVPALAVFGLWVLSVAAHAAFAIGPRRQLPGGVAGRVARHGWGRLAVRSRVGAHRRGRRDDGRVSLGESADADAGWVYSKEEGLTPSELASRGFTYLVSGSGSVPGYEVVEAVEGFKGLAVTPTRWPVVRARTEPMIWLHRRLVDDDEDDGEGRHRGDFSLQRSSKPSLSPKKNNLQKEGGRSAISTFSPARRTASPHRAYRPGVRPASTELVTVCRARLRTARGAGT